MATESYPDGKSAPESGPELLGISPREALNAVFKMVLRGIHKADTPLLVTVSLERNVFDDVVENWDYESIGRPGTRITLNQAFINALAPGGKGNWDKDKHRVLGLAVSAGTIAAALTLPDDPQSFMDYPVAAADLYSALLAVHVACPAGIRARGVFCDY